MAKRRKRVRTLKTCAQMLGHEGGLRGGPARARRLSRRRRRQIAREGALARFGR